MKPVHSAQPALADAQTDSPEARQRAAIGAMIGQHSRFVYRIAYSVLRNAADSEDVVQETFLQLLRGSPQRLLDGAIADEQGYLAQAVWRLAVKRSRRMQPDINSPEFLHAQPSSGRTPEDVALDNYLEARVHGCIDRLPAKFREPLVLAALGELTSPQIAALLGIPDGTVRRRIHEARQLLKAEMKTRKGGSQ